VSGGREPETFWEAARSKTTFTVLSGAQTAPRWLYGLSTVGEQPIQGAGELLVPVSPAVARALWRRNVPAELLGRLELWSRQR
jgi:hypothetical protein